MQDPPDSPAGEGPADEVPAGQSRLAGDAADAGRDGLSFARTMAGLMSESLERQQAHQIAMLAATADAVLKVLGPPRPGDGGAR